MLEDTVWKLPGEDRERIKNALAYFADPDDLIPDDVPGFGLLDDAVVIDLVCGALALKHDMEAYDDFCKYREAEEQRRGKTPKTSPEQWLESRRLQLQDRMRRRRIADWGIPARTARVGSVRRTLVTHAALPCHPWPDDGPAQLGTMRSDVLRGSDPPVTRTNSAQVLPRHRSASPTI